MSAVKPIKPTTTTKSPSPFHKRWCGPIPTKIMDVIHGMCLLAVGGAAIYNTVKTVQGKATIKALLPVYFTTLLASLFKIPSQICAGAGKVGGWLTVIGSIFTVAITAILIGFLLWDPMYSGDELDDVCIVDKGKKYCIKLEMYKIREKECASDTQCDCDNSGLRTEEDKAAFKELDRPVTSDQLGRGKHNPGHFWVM